MCADQSEVCDDRAQCNDGSDELHCCRPGEFRCTGTRVCIAGTLLCDGWEHCADGSDESTPACASANIHRQDVSAVPSETTKGTYLVAVLVVIFGIFTAVIGSYYCHKKMTSNEDLPDILHDSAGDPLSPKPNRNLKPLMMQKNGKNMKVGMEAVRMSTLNGSSIGSSYDRSHITGTAHNLELLRNIYFNCAVKNKNILIMQLVFFFLI